MSSVWRPKDKIKNNDSDLTLYENSSSVSQMNPIYFTITKNYSVCDIYNKLLILLATNNKLKHTKL